MDSLTHVVLGGCLGQLALGKKIGRKAIVWGAIADTIPDLDVFCNFFIHPIDGLLVHRGFTHSVLFAVLCSVGLGKLLANYYKKDGASWKEWATLLALGLFSHLFIDSLTKYGTGLLEPFCDHRFSYTTIFIADPAFTLPMLIGFIFILFKRPSWKAKKKVAIAALIISGFYLAWTFRNRWYQENYFANQFHNQHIVIDKQDLHPSPLNNILWGTMGKVDSGYYSGFHSLLGKENITKFHFFPSQDSLALPFENIREYKLLKRFAKGYSCLSAMQDGTVYFHDMRYGTATGWSDTVGDFNFKYPLIVDSIQSHHLIKRNPWNSKWEGTRGLWDEIWGK